MTIDLDTQVLQETRDVLVAMAHARSQELAEHQATLMLLEQVYQRITDSGHEHLITTLAPQIEDALGLPAFINLGDGMYAIRPRRSSAPTRQLGRFQRVAAFDPARPPTEHTGGG